MIPTKKDILKEGIEKLLEQFKGKPNIESTLKAYLLEIQELEDTWFELLNERNVYDAVGIQLDLIGAIVVEPRQGRDDEAYRLAILNRIGLNNSEGTPNNVMSLLKNNSGASGVLYWEHYPANTVYEVDVPELEDAYTYTPLLWNGREVTGTGFAEVSTHVSDLTTVGKSYTDLSQEASPAGVGSSSVIFDPNDNTFHGSELEETVANLITDNLDFVIDNNGNFIIVIDWEENTTITLNRTILPELPQSTQVINNNNNSETVIVL